MKYVSDSILSWQTKDWLDQPLHIVCGIWLALPALLLPPVCWPLGALVSVVYGARREYLQHRETQNFINLDLIFWGIGAIIPFITSYTLI